MAKPIEFGALFMLVLLWIGAISAATAGDSAIKPAKLFDLGIYVEDLDHSAAFYQTVFGLKVTKRWTYMTNFDKNGAEQKAELAGMYIGGGHGMSLEFLQRANVAKRQVAQEPINHFALAVDDVDAALDRALKAGAKLAFPGQRLFKTRAADMLVIHSQIIGLDGERIQILQELK